MPTINASVVNKVFLTFSHKMLYRTGNNYSYGNIDISIDGGTTWNQVFEVKTDHYYVKRNIIDVSSIAVGFNNVKFRFHYYGLGATTGGWAIDSVVVTDSVPCTSPPDSGFAVSNQEFVCTGSSAKLWLDDLARGIGQTYQWQLKNAASGNVWSNITGATTDTLNTTQNGSTYYRCEVTCGGLNTNSQSKYLIDTPTVCEIEQFSNVYGICPARPDTMRLTKDYSSTGVTYQWGWSPIILGWPYNPNAIYNNIAGANTNTYVADYANYQQTTFFACRLTCPVNNANRIGSEKEEWLNANTSCYCISYNNNSCNNGAYYDYVGIQSTTLNNTTSCVDTVHPYFYSQFNNYQFFSPQQSNTTATLVTNNTYNVQLQKQGSIFKNAVWIDYNHNSEFDASEYTYLGLTNTAGTLYSFPLTIPATALTGQTGMRIRGFYYFDTVDSNMACSFASGGTTHDYIVTIDSTVSVNNLVLNENGITLYPNPASDKLTVTSNQTITTAKLLTVTGSVVNEQQNVNDEKVIFDINTLPAGIYFAEVVTDKGRVARKWVKD
jgi:hypothetical protein